MKKLFIVFSSIFLFLLQIPIVHSAYRESIPIQVKGNLYILDLSINITFINNYGVVAIFLKPSGGYSYGFIVMKDPDENNPHVYLMIGNQSNWHDFGLLNETVIKFRLLIDYNLSKAIFIFNNRFKTYEFEYLPRIEYLYLSLFNIIDRSIDYPKIYIDYLRVYVLNTTLNNVNATIDNIETIINAKPIINSKKVYVPAEETRVETTREELEYPILTTADTFLAIIFVIIVIAVVVSVLLIIYYKVSK